MPLLSSRLATLLLWLLLAAAAALQPVASVLTTLLGPPHTHRAPASPRPGPGMQKSAQPSHYQHAINGWRARQSQTDAQARRALEARSHEHRHATGQRHQHDSADRSVLRQAGGSEGGTAPADGSQSAGGGAFLPGLPEAGTLRLARAPASAAAGWPRPGRRPLATQYPRRIERPPNPTA